MKKIIDKKMYNTETADEIVSDYYGSMSDYDFWIKTLYRTKKGKFFLYEEGGPSSYMSERVGNNEYGGSKNITLLSDKKALDIAIELEIDYDDIPKYWENHEIVEG